MHAIPAAATGVILVNLLVASLHGIAHVQLGVELSLWQQAFVVLVIVAAPLVSLVLFWTRLRKIAAMTLFLSMSGALVFGLYYHFVEISPDHVHHLPEGDARLFFVVTAVLLIPVEALGALYGLWSWRLL
jgi:amino acid permease